MVDASAYTFGFAPMDGGSAFANIETGEGASRKQSLFVLNRAGGTWEMVSVPGVPTLVGSWLYGASGNTLALLATDQPSVRFLVAAR